MGEIARFGLVCLALFAFAYYAIAFVGCAQDALWPSDEPSCADVLREEGRWATCPGGPVR